MIRIEKCDNGRIILKSTYNPGYIAKIKTLRGYKWHSEEKYWSLPPNDGVLEHVVSLFEGEKINIDPSLHLETLRKELALRKYSQKTIKVYIYYNEDFLRFVRKNPAEVNNGDVKDYLFYLADQKNSSASTLNIAINALNFYYGGILKRNFAYDSEVLPAVNGWASYVDTNLSKDACSTAWFLT